MVASWKERRDAFEFGDVANEGGGRRARRSSARGSEVVIDAEGDGLDVLLDGGGEGFISKDREWTA
jgi:hypothetical protein